jgi:hypothetical protein
MGDCDVCIGTDSIDEAFDFSSTETRKARKPHKCCECYQSITVGQQYEHVVGAFQGDFSVYDTCSLCVEIRTVFTCGNSWYYGQLWEEMRDYAFEKLTTASECFRELTPEAKAFVLQRWQVWKFGKANGTEA